MKKKELLFIAGILLAALVLWAGLKISDMGSHGEIVITVDGEEYGRYSLDEDQVIPIGDTNVCEIKDGKAFMLEANCPDHLCMRQASIDETGGTIVCLPNKIVIKGEKTDSSGAKEEPEIDAVV